MALYNKDYKDVIRSYKKKKISTILKIKEDPLEDFYIDLSSILNPIDQQYLYKKCFQMHHKYELESYSITKEKNHKTSFDSLLHSDGIIRKFLKISSNPDNDYLTGYYLGKFHVDKFTKVKRINKSNNSTIEDYQIKDLHSAFMFGGAKQNFLLGMFHALKDEHCSLNGYITDVKKFKSNKVNTYVNDFNLSKMLLFYFLHLHICRFF
jgi:hypothetical protein